MAWKKGDVLSDRDLLFNGESLLNPEDTLSEEHERQIARFRGRDYVPGERQRMIAFGRWKTLNKALMDERDRKEREKVANGSEI